MEPHGTLVTALQPYEGDKREFPGVSLVPSECRFEPLNVTFGGNLIFGFHALRAWRGRSVLFRYTFLLLFPVVGSFRKSSNGGSAEQF